MQKPASKKWYSVSSNDLISLMVYMCNKHFFIEYYLRIKHYQDLSFTLGNGYMYWQWECHQAAALVISLPHSLICCSSKWTWNKASRLADIDTTIRGCKGRRPGKKAPYGRAWFKVTFPSYITSYYHTLQCTGAGTICSHLVHWHSSVTWPHRWGLGTLTIRLKSPISSADSWT